MDNRGAPLEIHQVFLDLLDHGEPFALAVILKVEGSTPQKAGVKALIDGSGRIRGTLGGGIVEGLAQRHGAAACASGETRIFDFNLTNAYARDAGPICGGAMRILIDPNVAKHHESYAQAAEALRRRERGVLISRVRPGDPVEVTARWIPDEAVAGTQDFPGAEAVAACLAGETPRLFVDKATASDPAGATEVLIEPVIPKPMLLIVGGGHVGQALARQANWNGFEVTVLDDRAEFTHPDLFDAGVCTQCAPIAPAVAGFPMGPDTYVVIVTRGHKDDAEALEACIHAPAAYIGMIGSRRKVAMIRKNFLEAGIATAEEFCRVFAPVGLDLGAITVPEIATSIMAQLIAVRRKGAASGSGGDMRLS